jgi:hypothetical protein
LPGRDQLLGILHRLINARFGASTGFEQSDFCLVVTMGFLTAKSTICSIESATSGRSDAEPAILTSLQHMVDLLWGPVRHSVSASALPFKKATISATLIVTSVSAEGSITEYYASWEHF